jgi:hypothetical protein
VCVPVCVCVCVWLMCVIVRQKSDREAKE